MTENKQQMRLISGVTTSWIWAVESGGVHGVSIDPDRRHLAWFDDAAGCACGDSIAEQSYAAFEQDGPVLYTMPDDVLAEIRASVQVFKDR